MYDAHRVLDWNDDCAELNAQGWGENDWSDVGMEGAFLLLLLLLLLPPSMPLVRH